MKLSIKRKNHEKQLLGVIHLTSSFSLFHGKEFLTTRVKSIQWLVKTEVGKTTCETLLLLNLKRHSLCLLFFLSSSQWIKRMDDIIKECLSCSLDPKAWHLFRKSLKGWQCLLSVFSVYLNLFSRHNSRRMIRSHSFSFIPHELMTTKEYSEGES